MAKKKYLCLLLTVIFLGLVAWINRDLFVFDYSYPRVINFSPDIDPKGDYILSDKFILKPGEYAISFKGFVEQRGSGYYLLDAANEVFLSCDFYPDPFIEENGFYTDKVLELRMGVRYAPESGKLQISAFNVHSDYVLTKESFLRHGVITLTVFIAFLWLISRLLFQPFFKRVESKFHIRLIYGELLFLFFLALSIMVVFPFFGKNAYYNGDDFVVHLWRIEGIAQSLEKGIIPAKVYPGIFENYGWAAGYYYPDLFLYIPAVLRLLGFSLLDAYSLYCWLFTFLCAVSAFLAAKRISGGRVIAGCCASALYVFSAYYTICVYARSAVGEFSAFAFFPLIVLGLYNLFVLDSKNWKWLAVGFWGLINCHIISSFLCVLITAIFLLLHIKRIIKEPQIILSLIKAASVVALISAAFWIPFFEQLNKNTLIVNEISGTNVAEWTILTSPFTSLFYLFYPWRVTGWYKPYPGLDLVLTALFCAVYRRLKREKFSPLDELFIWGVVITVSYTKIFPWEIPFFRWVLTLIRLTFRPLGIGCAILAIFSGCVLSRVIDHFGSQRFSKVILPLFCVFCWTLSCGPFILNYQQSARKNKDNFILKNHTFYLGEYVPRSFTAQYAEKNRDTIHIDNPGTSGFTDGDLVIHDHKREVVKKGGMSFRFSYSLPDDRELTLSVPLLKFACYKGELIDASGVTHPLQLESGKRGLIAFSNLGFAEGTVKIWYEKTKLQIFSEVLTCLSCVALLLRKIIRN